MTTYLGSDAEIDALGVWTKYLHDDTKKVGNGISAQKFFHHWRSPEVTNASGGEVKRTLLRRGHAVE